jgi:hypothetical protein
MHGVFGVACVFFLKLGAINVFLSQALFGTHAWTEST